MTSGNCLLKQTAHSDVLSNSSLRYIVQQLPNSANCLFIVEMKRKEILKEWYLEKKL